MTYNFGIHGDFYVRMVNTEDGPVENTVDVYYVGCSDADGHCWVLDGSETEDLSFAEHLLQHLDHDPETRPEVWHATTPIYGSNAWDSEAEYELACFEADAYGEPRPRW